MDCPNCKNLVESFDAENGMRYLRCPVCGYEEAEPYGQ